MIDAFVSHLWDNVDDIAPWIEPGWRGALGRGNTQQKPVRVPPLYADPRGAAAYREWNGTFNKGLEFKALQEEILEGTTAERVVLGYDEEGLGAAGYVNPFTALAICRALNDWTLEEWVAKDDRLYALAVVPTNYAEGAADEIRRIGQNERIVGVELGPNILGVPYGMNVYDPIYEAAVEMDLPIVLHTKADVAVTLSTPQTAGGLPATYAEYHMLSYQSPATHLVSMIGQGIFDMYPSLNVLIVGAGSAWIPSSVWRADWAYGYSYNESPWLTKLPSEYFGQHVKVTTFGLERPRKPEQLAQVLKTMPWFDQTLVYASGYPSIWGCEGTDAVLARLPEDWHDGILADNARDFFRWPDRPPKEKPKATLRRSAMPIPNLESGDFAAVTTRAAT